MKTRSLFLPLLGLFVMSIAACRESNSVNKHHLKTDRAGPNVPGPVVDGPYAPGPTGSAPSGGASTVPTPDTSANPNPQTPNRPEQPQKPAAPGETAPKE